MSLFDCPNALPIPKTDAGDAGASRGDLRRASVRMRLRISDATGTMVDPARHLCHRPGQRPDCRHRQLHVDGKYVAPSIDITCTFPARPAARAPFGEHAHRNRYGRSW